MVDAFTTDEVGGLVRAGAVPGVDADGRSVVGGCVDCHTVVALVDRAAGAGSGVDRPGCQAELDFDEGELARDVECVEDVRGGGHTGVGLGTGRGSGPGLGSR